MSRIEIPLILLLLVAGCGGGAESPAGESPEVADASVAAESTLPSGLEYPNWQTVAPGENALYNQRANLVQRGHLVYQKYCVGCHGETGAGDGPAAVRLITKPRDFTSGIYKFRSTGSGSLPLEADLDRTITRGLARVSMPGFPLMPEAEKLAVIEYIKTFYPAWEAEKDRRLIVPVPRPPEDLASEERLWRGRMVYLQMGCGKCHGVDGRGTGATQTEYVDAWGQPQKPFDFTRGSLKGGNSAEDIYRTFHTGLRSIMPSFGGETLAAVTAEGYAAIVDSLADQEAARLAAVAADFPADGAAVFSQMSEGERLALAERNSWDLVAYILSLRRPTTTATAVLGDAG
ncbi:MAG: c-type cytochrome [Acidobacteriota bacterium]